MCVCSLARIWSTVLCSRLALGFLLHGIGVLEIWFTERFTFTWAVCVCASMTDLFHLATRSRNRSDREVPSSEFTINEEKFWWWYLMPNTGCYNGGRRSCPAKRSLNRSNWDSKPIFPDALFSIEVKLLFIHDESQWIAHHSFFFTFAEAQMNDIHNL